MNGNAPVVVVAAGMLFATCGLSAREATPTREDARRAQKKTIRVPPARRRDYTFAWWLNGFRKETGDDSPDVFCVETGRYAFTLNLADFRKARLGCIDGPGYLAAAKAGAKSLNGLSPAELRIELEHRGQVYRALSCLAGRTGDLRHTILLESGRFAQHYRFLDIEFRDDAGHTLETDSALELVAWPSSLTFRLTVAPDCAYEDGPCPGVVGAGRCVRGKPIDAPHQPALDPQTFTLEVWVNVPKRLAHLNGFHWLVGKNAKEWEDGNFGLLLNRQTVTAIMNIGGGPENVYRAERRHALTPGRWHHLAMTYDNDTLRLYVDGRPAGSTKVGKVRTPGHGKLRIGGRPDGWGKPVHALFDELRIWNRALTPGAIKAHSKHPDRFARNGLTWRMSFDEDLKPGQKFPLPNLDGARMRITLNRWTAETDVQQKWDFGVAKELVLHCPIADEPRRNAAIEFEATGAKGAAYPVRYVEAVAAYVVDIPKFERDWKTGYTDIRNYDEVALRVDNKSGATQYAPMLFDVKRPANITGITPILCDAAGRPTGIPVQLSKNWHHGAYAKFYAILPLPPGRTEYRLRIAYGFWGALPAASHAQLSLFGYGGNGRWDQMAIGCWGETMCLDVDNSLTPIMVTDVRMLFTRNGKKGRKWSWSDGGWGGDWLCVYRSPDNKLHPVELKTAYLAHGPCLTDVRYAGFFGKARDVAFDAQVGTLRTDDYNRVFQHFRYRFEKPLAADGAYFFRQGPNTNLLTPRIAYGNRDGLIAEREVPGQLQRGDLFEKQVVLRGEGPWWVAFPGSFFSRTKDWGTGSRALIIRSFKAVLGGNTYSNPVVSFPVQAVDGKRRSVGCDLELVPPLGVARFMPGDSIELEVEWITVPRVADDYYGPNQAFLEHLRENPESWKTVYREAVGNDLAVRVAGGRLLHRYPLVVAAEAPEVQVTIRGGVGAVPIRFEGLPSATGYTLYRLEGARRIPLDQSVHGNDFWQADYDAESETYKLTFNLPLDGLEESTWILAHR